MHNNSTKPVRRAAPREPAPQGGYPMKKVSILDLQRMKAEGEKITMLTAYDFPIGRLVDQAGCDVILVGDSAGNVIHGHSNTLPVTMDEMIVHTRAVTRAAERALVVGDMPFMSYQASFEDARRNAGRFLKEGGAGAVKIEGGINMADTIRAISDIDIPVMAHIGLTPQSIHRMGGYKVQGRGDAQRAKLLDDARAIEDAGAFSVVLEVVPSDVAAEISKALTIPTIGIGAGPDCDGQVLVINDLLGLMGEFRPKFVKRYLDLNAEISRAVGEYCSEVKGGEFPAKEHCFD